MGIKEECPAHTSWAWGADVYQSGEEWRCFWCRLLGLGWEPAELETWVLLGPRLGAPHPGQGVSRQCSGCCQGCSGEPWDVGQCSGCR